MVYTSFCADEKCCSIYAVAQSQPPKPLVSHMCVYIRHAVHSAGHSCCAKSYGLLYKSAHSYKTGSFVSAWLCELRRALAFSCFFYRRLLNIYSGGVVSFVNFKLCVNDRIETAVTHVFTGDAHLRIGHVANVYGAAWYK